MLFLRVILFFLVLLLLPDWYIYKVYIRGRCNRMCRRLYWLPTIVLLLALVIFIIWHDTDLNLFGKYLIVTLCIAIPKLIFTLVSLLLRVVNRVCRIALPHATLSLVCAVGMFGYIIYGAVEGKKHFRIREVVFASPDLPAAFDGYRILQISDIHSGSWTDDGKALRQAIELCNMQCPDLTVFTGDLINSRADEMTRYMPILRQLKARDGVFSVTGNHDYGTYVHWDTPTDSLANIDSLIMRERRMGWRVLMNEHAILRRGTDSIALVGVENSGNPPFPNQGNLPKALQGTKGMFKVLLSHDPTHWRRAVLPQTDIQLMLAGHTHDMQISAFGFSPSRFVYPEHNGFYFEGERALFVNIGLGHVLFPMRIGAWPDITVITLRRNINH